MIGAPLIDHPSELIEFSARAVEHARTREERMTALSDALWSALSPRGVSWLGFYLDNPASAPTERLTLGPRRDGPACSPIGIHGVCGTALLTNQIVVVADVNSLGGNYVACDPRDRSEIVIPCRDSSGVPWGVLDLDSHSVGCFCEADGVALESCLRAAGLTH